MPVETANKRGGLCRFFAEQRRAGQRSRLPVPLVILLFRAASRDTAKLNTRSRGQDYADGSSV